MRENIEATFQPLLDEEDVDTLDTSIVPVVPGRKRTKRRLWSLLLVAVLIVAVVLSGVLYWALTQPAAVQYTQVAVTSGNMSVKISSTGPLNAGALYAMNFSVAGQVHEIDVQDGQQVTQGQVLAKVVVDTTALQDSINQAQLGVTSAQNSLNAAQVAATNAVTAVDNQKASSAASLNSAYDQEQNDLNACSNPNAAPNCQQIAKDKYAQAQSQATSSNTSAQNQVTSANNQVVSAQDALNRAQAQLQAAQHNMDTANNNANLVAPANATVAAINGVVGQSVGATGGSSASSSGSASSSSSSSSSSAFIILTDTSKMSISAQVNEADIGNVQVGQPAQFSVSAYPSSLFRANVSAVQTIGQTTSNVVSYTVLLAVDASSLQNTHLYPGMTATVNITTAQRIGALLLPTSALSFPSIALQNKEIDRSVLTSSLRGSASGAGQGSTGSTQRQGATRTVLQLRNGKLVPAILKVGLNNGQSVEVLSGLKEGDQVVVGQTGGNNVSSSTSRGTGGFGGGGAGGGGRNGGGTGGN